MSESELYFRYQCEEGLKKRGLKKLQKYIERLQYEVDIITKLGFCEYFLIVSDIIQWALSQQIPVGPGRGSAAGSLVSYCLEITHLDPIKYELIFERFLNPDRVSWPDIDIDICEARRDEVLQYIKDKYGKDKVAHIGTFNSMKAKGAIRDITRTLGLPYPIGDKLANLVLEPIAGKAQPLVTCYEKVPLLYNFRYGEMSQERQILEWAEKVENRIRSFGTHASGIVISPFPITQLTPLSLGKDNAPTSQFDMSNIEEIGLIKFDFLGLRAITTIKRCTDLIFEKHGIEINPLTIPLDDKETFDALQAGDVTGIFQLESSTGIRELLVQIRPTCLEDISTLVALYRPGPLGSNALQHYLKVRAGQANAKYTVPELKPILSKTDGMLIYQEQILEICKELAGYTMSEADLMRRAIGKKKPEEMEAQYIKFIQGMQNNGFSSTDAETIWHEIEFFAMYGFNASHAISYAFITYQMAYLKTHYPLEFMCACLISDSNEPEKIIQYIGYCKERGIEIKPPSINQSSSNFSIDENSSSIRFGLSAIKNLGKPIDSIIQERKKNGEFKDILNFAERIDLSKIHKLKLESLVLAGALDNLDGKHNRASMLAAIEEILNYKEEKKRYDARIETYEKRMEKYHARTHTLWIWSSLTPEELKERKKNGQRRPASVKKPELPIPPNFPTIPSLPELSKIDLLNKEKELLGFFVSGHPLDLFIKPKNTLTIQKIKQNVSAGKIYNKTQVNLTAIPNLIKEITTKAKKQKMAYITLEDKTGILQGVILPDTYMHYAESINIQTPALYKANIEIIEGDIEKVAKLIILQINDLVLDQSNSQEKKDLIFNIQNHSQAIEMINKLKLIKDNETNTSFHITENPLNKWIINNIKGN